MYVYTQDVPIDLATYHKVIAALGSAPIAGSLLHLCVRAPEGGLRYIEVWESEAACTKAFNERIHRAVDQAFGGKRPVGEHRVELLELVHASGRLLDAQSLAV